MKRQVLCVAWGLMSLLLFSCNDDDGYVYPSVQLEFLTARTGSDGRIQYVVTDGGIQLAIEKDHTRTQTTPDSAARIVANCELLTEADGQKEIRIYTLINAVAPVPVRAEKFANGVRTDPVEVQGIWMGNNYLNMVLALQAQNKMHRFHFVEDSVKLDESDKQQVYLTLYHDAGEDMEAYTRRAYLSVPLQSYAGRSRETVLFFSLQTYDGGKETYRFDYKPTEN